jgi:uncharacterized protein
MHGNFGIRQNVAVVGTGISGMSAAWLISRRHNVTVYEQDRRVGGHSNTVTVPTRRGPVPVDTGFIVYNEATYPNLTALLAHLNIATQPSDMSFAVSLADGDLEYSGGNLSGLFAQPRNLVRPRFWSMLNDLQRFYREAPRELALIDGIATTLGDYLDTRGYGAAFKDDHLLPMAGAIWSASPRAILDYPAAAFIRFHENHGLLRLRNRPQWRTVTGGSRSYVAALTASFADRIRTACGVASITRTERGVRVVDRLGCSAHYDQVVVATHADQALALLGNATAAERRVLGAFRYSRNRTLLHADAALMPKRRAVWSAWNYIGSPEDAARPGPMVTYWMNALQSIPQHTPLFVTLNPRREPDRILHEQVYEHPTFDAAAIAAQRKLWSLQGKAGIWFCGSYFGSGFHEDGLQSGLAVAEALAGVRRPWQVADESGRIVLETAVA